MAVITGQPCQVLDALAQFQYDVLRRLNRKFNSLRRIAELLEQVGDITPLIPNIGNLIPIQSITLETYQRLVENCPFLGLPDVNEGNLAELRLRVEAAYASLIRKLLNHPHIRMEKLQGVLDRAQDEMNAGAAVISDYLTCLQTICDTVGAVGTAFENITQANIKKEISEYTKNFVNNAGQVMTEGMSVKAQQVRAAIHEMHELSAETVTDTQDTANEATGLVQ